MKYPHSFLQSLGFTQKESVLYCVLLEHDAMTAATLASLTGINRTTVYDVLLTLVQKGLVSKYAYQGVTVFQALRPERLHNYLEREKEESIHRIDVQQRSLQEYMPAFLSLFASSVGHPKVQFFEGEKGMREAYEDTLTAQGMIYAYTNVATMIEKLPHFFPDYFIRRAKLRIPIKAIFVDNNESRFRAENDREELRQTRFFPKGIVFSPEVKIYNNKMLIASWSETVSVIVESAETITLQRAIFELLWESL
ncbi:MAG: helix-turn-helix domain-containing protein [Candidatus Kerfeldbacteria bacterium]|nr:helix-turn-helix domain-containing protein [Candidatus Kerfeldbacteria bacterium]